MFGKPYEPEIPARPALPEEVLHSVHLPPISPASLRLTAKENMPVIRVVPEQLITELVYRDVPREGDAFLPGKGPNKLVVLERHHGTGNIGLGIVEGMNIHNGAIASTVAHDSHNMVVVGDNDGDILTAIAALAECGGGYAAVSGGEVLARLSLPIAGLITDASLEEVLAAQRALLDAAKRLGADERADPLVLLSFLALPVIGHGTVRCGEYEVHRLRVG